MERSSLRVARRCSTVFQWMAVVTVSVLIASCNTVPSSREYLPEPARGALEGDYLRIQGTWTVVYNELKLQPTPQLHGALHIFREDRFRLGDDPPGSERFILDETSNPKRIDFDDGRPPRILGIYKLERNRLTVCTGGPGEPRPTEFKTSPFSGTILTQLERR